jgi:3-hydroxybutyryl-CoA dehydrogenase
MVVGEGPLAEGLRGMVGAAGLAAVGEIGRAGLVVVAGVGPLEVRRLGVRDALRQAAEGATVLAHCAPYSVTEVVSTLRRTERVAGFTLLGEPGEARLVEVAGGMSTADEAVEVGLGFVRALGKAGVRVGDGPGMILLRVISALTNEAAAALDDGVATAEGIDTAMRLGVSYPLGPLEWGDHLGPEVVLQTMRTLQADYGDDRYRPAVALRRAVQSGTPLRRG